MALGLLHDPEEGDEHFTAMYERYGYYTGHDFLEFGSRLGLPEKPIRTFIARLESQQNNITSVIERSFMPDDMKARADSLVGERIRAVLRIKT